MRKKALAKDFRMEIRKSLNRFLSIFFIVALGVAFFAGVRATEPDMRYSGDEYFDERNMMDLKVMSTLGLTDDDMDAILAVEGVEAVNPGYMIDVLSMVGESERIIHVESLPETMNQVDIVEGRLPGNAGECIVDVDAAASYGIQIGDVLEFKSGNDQELDETLQGTSFEVVGTCSSPVYISFGRGSTNIGNGEIDMFAYIDSTAFCQEVYSQAWITAAGAKEVTAFTDAYTDIVDRVKEQVEGIEDVRCDIRYTEILEEAEDELAEAEQKIADAKEDVAALEKPVWYVNDRDSDTDYVGYSDNADRMGAIGKVFPLLFFLVAAFVSLTTMTRMVEEQRMQIGTLKALGYSKFWIAAKFVGYALIATLGGSIVGVLFGQKVFPLIIVNAYKIIYIHMPNVVVPYNMHYAVMATVAAVACTMVATISSCYAALAAQPAELMRPEAPKVGKKVFLERIPAIWIHLSFTWKSTIRNLMRYKKRFFMTIFGIGGCMALMLVGYGLKDSIMDVAILQFDKIQVYDLMAIVDEDIADGDREELHRTLEEDDRVNSYMDGYMRMTEMTFGDVNKDIYLYVPSRLDGLDQFVTFNYRTTGETWYLDEDSVVITEKVARDLGISKGDKIQIKLEDDRRVTVEITDICENYLSHYLYIAPQLYASIAGAEPEYNNIFATVREDAEDELTQVGEELLKNDAVLTVSYTNNMAEILEDMIQVLDSVIIVLIVSAGMLAFVVLYNLNNININERKRELATLKVLGFYDSEVGAYVYRENILLTLIGSGVGVFLGKWLHRFVVRTVEVDQTMFGLNITLESYLISIAFTILFSLLVNGMMYFKLKKIDMVESLKSVE